MKLKEDNEDLRVMSTHWRTTLFNEVAKISKFIEEAGPREYEGKRGGFSMDNDGWTENGGMFKDVWDDESDHANYTSPEKEESVETLLKSSLKKVNSKRKEKGKVNFKDDEKQLVELKKKIVIELSSSDEESEEEDLTDDMTLQQARLILGAAKRMKTRKQNKKSGANGKL